MADGMKRLAARGPRARRVFQSRVHAASVRVGRNPATPASVPRRDDASAVALNRSRTVRVGSWFGSSRANARRRGRGGASRARAFSASKNFFYASSARRRRRSAPPHSSTGIGTGGTAGRARGGGRGGRAVPGVVPRREKARRLWGLATRPRGTSGRRSFEPRRRRPGPSRRGRRTCSRRGFWVTTRRCRSRAACRASLCGRRRRGERVWQQLDIHISKTRVRTRARHVSDETYRRGSRGRGSSAEIANTWHRAATSRDRAPPPRLFRRRPAAARLV